MCLFKVSALFYSLMGYGRVPFLHMPNYTVSLQFKLCFLKKKSLREKELFWPLA